MRAVGLVRYLPVTDPHCLVDIEIDRPVPMPRDLLVRVEAVSVNPVDTKVRAPKATVETVPKVLGYDAAGVVEAVGEGVTLFRPGDKVFYAGSIIRPGTNAEWHCVDERIVGRMPVSLDFADAAALPLTSLTAWEGLFERMGIPAAGAAGTLLVLGGAGGVGSMVTQLAKRAGLRVVATASRPETREWCVKMGAAEVIDHRQPLPPQLAALGLATVEFIFNASDTDAYWPVMAELIAPLGRICCLVDNREPVPLNALKKKSATFAWEFMFTRSMFGTADMGRQGEILNEIASAVDAGAILPTRTETLGPINAATLREAHARVESGKGIGKLVVAGWR